LLHAIVDADRVDRQALVDGARHRFERRRIEPHDASVLPLQAAAAVERSDQRDRASSRADEIDIDRQPSGHRRTAVAGKELGDISGRDLDLTAR